MSPAGVPQKLGKYEVRSVVGQGAMGIVYEGYDPDIRRRVALKVLHEHLVNTPEGKELQARFRREAQAAAQCFHPNIVTVFELGHEGARDFIAMEYVQGEELKYFIDSGYHFSREEIHLIVSEVLRGLAAAHEQGVVHRDIKPANIILLDNGRVKIADFGVARLDDSDLTLAGNMVGTPSYMSPEGLRAEAVDFRADLYSTAMVLLELLTGSKPSPHSLYEKGITHFVDSVLSETPGCDLPGDLQAVIRQGLAADREQRFSSAAAFIQALEATLADTPPADETLVSLSQTVIARKHSREAARPAIPEWDSSLLKALEEGLASYIGPFAGVLVKRASSSTTTPQQLVDSLAGQLEDEQERNEFIRRARRCIDDSGVAVQSGSGQAAPLSERFSVDDRQRLVRELAFHIGPIARPLVTQALQRHTAVEACFRELLEQIPEEQDRDALLRQFISGFPL